MAEWSKKRRTMRHYDQSAAVYDTQYCEEQEAKIKAALNGVTLEKENMILDSGCGTGLFFPHVVERVKLVVGLDISGSILREAKRRQREHSNTALIRADADCTPFPNETFDTVFAITLLQNMPRPLQTLNEMKRVTIKNAIVVATGLRKAFSKKEFTRLLGATGLEIKALRLDENLKEYVAICTKPQRKP